MATPLPRIVKMGQFLESPSNSMLAIVAMIAIFRPLIMLTDKAVPKETRQYAATREFFSELFGLTNLFVVAKNLEYLTTVFVHDKLNPNKEEAITSKILAPLKKGHLKKALQEYGQSKQWISNVLKDQHWEKLARPLQNARGASALVALFGTIYSTGIGTPFMNNYFIDKPVLDAVARTIDKVTHFLLGSSPQQKTVEKSPFEFSQNFHSVNTLTKPPFPDLPNNKLYPYTRSPFQLFQPLSRT